MGVEEIRQICINGSEVYYNYLKDNNKGIQEIHVQKIEAIHKGIFSIKIAQAIFDTDALYFKLLDNNEIFDTNVIRIVEYDRDAKLLVIRVSGELITRFSQLHKNDLLIYSDLKFLVQRVKEWYEINGGSIALPQSKSSLSESIDELEFFSDSKPSQHQIAAIESIFTHPFTYVWGAPGTGKTQFVLAYSILHYLKKGKRVAIFGPTNNAIEQVLRGVIKMTDKAGIDRKRILRLGGPSKKFAEEFPEVCEERGLLQRIKEIDAQIEIIKSVIKHKDPNSKLSLLHKADDLLIRMGEWMDKLRVSEKDLGKIGDKYDIYKSKNDQLRKRFQDAQLQHNKASKKANGFINKITKYFSSSDESQADLKLKFSLEELSISQQYYDKSSSALSLIEDEVKAAQNQVDRCGKEIIRYKDGAISIFNQFEDIKELAKKISIVNYAQIQEIVKDIIHEEEGHEKVKGAIAEHYQALSVTQLEHRITELETQCSLLKSRTTEERIKNVGIIAATLDCYIGRFSQVKLDVDHLFLDEAGYANIVKALTLFNHQLPITFLGDHMQLPPVCEFDQMQIQNDARYYDVFVWSQSSIYIEALFGGSSKQQNLALFGNAQLPIFHSQKKSDLIKTFRFAGNLATVLDRNVYKNGFHSEQTKGDTQILLLNAEQVEPVTVRRTNPAEAKKILALIEQLDTDDFVILCPYRKQIDLICDGRRELRTEQKVLTVHGSQGREWDIVILSVVDENSRDLWFMDATNKVSRGLNLINTAVSRAKKELIIVCNQQFWMRQNGQLLRDLLSVSEPYPLKEGVKVL